MYISTITMRACRSRRFVMIILHFLLFCIRSKFTVPKLYGIAQNNTEQKHHNDSLIGTFRPPPGGRVPSRGWFLMLLYVCYFFSFLQQTPNVCCYRIMIAKIGEKA